MPPDHPPDPELLREQSHLAASRRALARMRAKTRSLDSSAASDRVSQQFLESAMYRRMKALEDDPTVPLFFGRLDYGAEQRNESFHVGRRHVTDETGDPMVVDWRAPISLPFYRASAKEPMGVERRRRFGFQTGTLTAYEDERLLDHEQEEYSRILEEEIERPRVGPMRDIVATIQPEQDVIVRAGLSESICVQGAPGTGKTAVGLHRAAYLLYTHREQLVRQGVLVVGPNASFLRYIGDVLPALGEIDARQATIDQLVGERTPIRATESPEVAALKGDARMAEVLERAVWGSVQAPTEPLVVPRGSSRWRIPAHEVEEILTLLRSRGVRYGAARLMLAQRLAHAVLVKMELAGDSPDDRVQDAVARSRPVKQYVDQVWPPVRPDRIVHRLLSEPDYLAATSAGILTDDERALLFRVKRTWTLADAVLVDEAADLVERTPSLAHVVADEAQDLSPMMLRAVGRRCTTGSTTVLGDLAQATTPWATRSWDEALHHLGKTAHIEELTQGFRVPGAVIEFAARLLPVIAPGLTPPTSVRRSRGDLTIEPGLDVVRALSTTRVGSVGVIVPEALLPTVRGQLDDAGIGYEVLGSDEEPLLDKQVDVVPASVAKGLEFDHVVLIEPAAVVAGEPDRVTGLRRLYVCLTRAVTSLVVLHEQPLPDELGSDTVSSDTVSSAPIGHRYD